VKKTAAKTRKNKRAVTRTAKSTASRGVSKIILIAIVAVILAVGGGAYVLSQNGSLPAGMALNKPALNPNCKQNDPELCKFLNNWAVSRSYTTTSTSNIGGMTIESIMKMSGADKFQMISKQNGKENSNMISIGGTTYTLDYSDNKWFKMTLKPEETEAKEAEMKDEVSLEDDLTEDNTIYKFITKEACGSLTCFKYLLDVADPDGMKQYVWFDDREYLTRKVRMEDGKGMFSESVYSYGNVSITAPSPTKEGAPGIGAGEGYSEEEAQKMMKQYQQSAGSSESNDASYDTETPVDDSSDNGF
jgi:hypothetical protein